jgi:4-amino-4-deoxy-L-arabinose transferase-like glycosyltransferase
VIHRSALRRWLLIGAFVLWLFFVVSSFFAVQKPFSATSALAAADVLLNLLTAGWLTLIGLALGVWLLRALLGHDLPLAETLVLGTALGLGALGLLSFGLGLLGFFRPTVAWPVTLALSGLATPPVIRLVRQWRGWRPSNLPHRWTALYLGAVALLALLVALLPPTDWDGLFYHLTGPRLYLGAGRIVGGVGIPHLSFPALMEMLYAWAMLLRGDVAAKLLHAVFGLLLAGLVYLIAHRFLSPKAAWPAVTVFASMPMVGTLAGWAYNDLSLAFCQLASLYAFIKSQVSNPKSQIADRRWWTANSRWLVLSGIFSGLALGLKYTGFVAPLTVSVLLLWRALCVRRNPLRPLLAFAVPAVLIALPWYAKNWAFTGNPVYPFLFGLFDGQYWDNFRAAWYSAAGTGIGLRWPTLLALPWLATLGLRDVNYWDGRIGPLFLLFLPLILLYGVGGFRRRDPDQPAALSPLLFFAVLQFGFWTLGVIWSRSLWQSRLLLPCLTTLAPVIGWLWTDLPRFDQPRFRLGRFVALIVGLVLALTLVDISLLTLRIAPLPYLVGTETRDEYLTRRLGAYYATMQQLNGQLPDEATVVFLWEPRSYYCQRDCRPDSILDTFPHMVYQYGFADAIAQAWRQRGVTHVLIHRSGLNFVLNESPRTVNTAVLAELETRSLRLLFDVAGAYQVYALESAPRASKGVSE